jgi:23S rRNA-intervening sequence protein
MPNNGAKSFRELRVWESALAIKRSLHELADGEGFKKEERLRHQLREAAASAVSHISEDYARFDPQARRNAERIKKRRSDVGR